jgi:putative two-component system response regulator
MDATEDEQRGLALGAVDYMTKPLRPAIVLARVQTHLALRAATAAAARQRRARSRDRAPRMHENQVVQDVTIRALARLAETRDNDTGHHILRTQAYVRLLAQLLCDHPRFAGSSTPTASR